MTFTSLFLRPGLLSLTHKYKQNVFLALLTCMQDRWLASPQLCWLRRSSPGATWPRGPLAKATVCDTPVYVKLNLAIGELHLSWAWPGLLSSPLPNERWLLGPLSKAQQHNRATDTRVGGKECDGCKGKRGGERERSRFMLGCPPHAWRLWTENLHFLSAFYNDRLSKLLLQVNPGINLKLLHNKERL